AEQLMRAEINQLKADLKSQRDSMFAEIAALLGLNAGSRGSSLTSYSDTTSGTFISQEQQQREVNYYADLMLTGKIGHYALVAAGLQVAEPGRGHEKWYIHPEALNPPAGIRSLVSIVNSNRPGSIMGNAGAIINILNAGPPIIGQVGLAGTVRSSFMANGDLDSAILQFAGGTGTLRTRGNSYVSSTCTGNAAQKLACSIPIIAQVEGTANGLYDTRFSLDSSIGNVASAASRVKSSVARLRQLTEITSGNQLLNVLSESKWGLNATDLSFLKNISGNLSTLKWEVNGQSIGFNELVGDDGGAVAQQKNLTDAYGLYRRGTGTNHVVSLGVSGNEFLSALSTLAETQYTVVRDAYF
ncbi:hypothetical protein, partial [Leptospira yanagawae]|uniref:hypothetical protein n=1 Tax=Leptospira yanagawae TaxID=293069 RepID=UPI003CC837D6